VVDTRGRQGDGKDAGTGVLVAIELLYAHWETQSLAFPLPNGRLAKIGVSRETKRRVLRRLETVRLITVERRHGKTSKVTLTIL
jgi:hypothetical protein